MEIYQIELAIDYFNKRLDKENLFYGERPSIHTALKILEKQIPMKPILTAYRPFKDIGWSHECPSCKCAVGINNNDIDYTQEDEYCPSCSQRLDWSE